MIPGNGIHFVVLFVQVRSIATLDIYFVFSLDVQIIPTLDIFILYTRCSFSALT